MSKINIDKLAENNARQMKASGIFERKKDAIAKFAFLAGYKVAIIMYAKNNHNRFETPELKQLPENNH